MTTLTVPPCRRVRRRGLAAAALAALALGVGVSSPIAAQEAAPASAVSVLSTDLDDFPQVALRIRVSGEAALDELSPASFEVRENGTVRPVRRVETAATGDLEVMVVFDRSGSMAGAPLTAAKSAVTSFIERLPSEVRVGLVGVSTAAVVEVAPTLDRDAMRAAIDGLVAEGRTALYDGLYLAADGFTDTTTRQLIVALSDGGDNSSLATFDDIDTRLEDVAVEAVELVTAESDRAPLDSLVNPGPVRSVTSPDDLEAVYGAVVEQLLSEAVVTYRSTSESSEALTVEVRLAGTPWSSGASVDVTPSSTVPNSTPPSTTQPATTEPATTEPATTEPAATATTAAVPVDTVAPTATEATSADSRVLIGAVLVAAGVALALIGLLVVRRRTVGNRLPAPITPSWSTLPPRRAWWLRFISDDNIEAIGGSLRRAGVTTSPGEFVLIVVAVTLGVTALLFVLLGPVGLFGLITPLFVRSRLRARAKSRREKFIGQLPDTLQVLASMLRAGYGLVQAIDAVARESDDPTNIWFDRVLLEVRAGRDLGEALKALGEEVQSVDFDWVVVAVEINREVGGEMARTLESVAETVRERDKLRGQIRALTAEGRASAYLMLALPPFAGVFTIITSRDYGAVLLEPVGFGLIGAAGVLMAVGWLWISRIIDKVAK